MTYAPAGPRNGPISANASQEAQTIITTMNDLPGYDVEEVLGEVFGLTVRARNIGSQLGASFKSLVGES